jgi:hypothetical protein
MPSAAMPKASASDDFKDICGLQGGVVCPVGVPAGGTDQDPNCRFVKPSIRYFKSPNQYFSAPVDQGFHPYGAI